MSKGAYSIFGRRWRIHWGPSVESRTLQRELSVYEEDGAPGGHEVEVHIDAFPPWKPILTNPSNHVEAKEGFVAIYPQAHVGFHFRNGALAEVWLGNVIPGSGCINLLRRWKSMQYASPAEAIGQTFHELALLPAMAFDPSAVLVHASAWELPSGKAVLVGGTGGVGKTSLQLEFCGRRGCSFLADDIAVLSSDGILWPNLAFPKVYGYNLDGDQELASKLWAGRGWMDRLHWLLHLQRGPACVRRRVSPTILYGKVQNRARKLGQYLFLVRENRDDVQIECIDSARMAELSVNVIRAEYQVFFQHLLWHEVNRSAMCQTPLLTLNQLIDRWTASLRKALTGVECRVLRVGAGVDKRTLSEQVAAVLEGARN